MFSSILQTLSGFRWFCTMNDYWFVAYVASFFKKIVSKTAVKTYYR